ncbi:PAS domain S-box protein [Pleurocapsa sp. PCC 7319]|uniref:PAS domain-containing sensor histidine kinase n=1 Tax=Pleurocapsa sp. PCC 7319 TaxID=118161 RepID=UPI000344B964|nr:PAS domain S-box protein [Pleurocapsa sp. PCC 7319]
MNELATIASFMPHGMCYLWKPGLVGLHLVGDGIIALSYFSIPITLMYILRKRTDIPFNSIFWLFAAFILFCGAGHAFNIWTLWHPDYWISGVIRLLTGLVSLATAIVLIIKIPQILTLPSPKQINRINQKLQEKIVELEQQKSIIRQQEEFLRSIYDNVQEAIFVVDMEADGIFRYQGFNSAAKRLTGIEDVNKKTPSELFPSAIAAVVEQHYRECLDSKTTISYEECLPFCGEETWWLTTINPIPDKTGKINRIVGTSLNITERKQAETELDREKNFLQALLDNLSDGIVSCDENGFLTLFNKATQKLHGLPHQAIPANEWAKYYDLYLPDGKAIMSQDDIPLFRALQGESVRDVEMMIIPKQGKPRIILANGDPIVDRHGKKIGALAAMRDITERRQAEKALAQLNDDLEARVKQRTIQLEQVNAKLLTITAQLEKRNQELDQFAYVTSHDLKAPLRAIANLSEWIEEDLEDKLDEDTRYNMSLLRGRVRRLENLINGLLDYSRVGRLHSEPQSINVGEMLAEIIDLLNVPADYTIEIQGNMPTLITELIPLQQVFHNLISNAIKHSDRQNSKITISVREQDNFYEFAVADNGKGIDPQYHERIFSIFQTLEARDNQESTGIGLAIVKKAVENQGGKIAIESQINQGTTFYFTWLRKK